MLQLPWISAWGHFLDLRLGNKDPDSGFTALRSREGNRRLSCDVWAESWREGSSAEETQKSSGYPELLWVTELCMCSVRHCELGQEQLPGSCRGANPKSSATVDSSYCPWHVVETLKGSHLSSSGVNEP